MINLESIGEEFLTAFFLSDPSLCLLGLPDDKLVELAQTKRYTISPGHYNQAIYIDGELSGLITWSLFSQNTLNIHIYVPTKLRGQDICCKVFKHLTREVWAPQAWLKKIIVMVPRPCIHIQCVAKKAKFKLEATLKKGMVWRQKDVDVLIYSYFLRGDK